MLEPDPFGLALHALTEQQKHTRASARTPDGYPTASSDPTGDAVQISDPDAFAAAAINNTHQRLAQLVHGERNAGLNNEAMSLGHLVGGDLLDYDDTAEWLDRTAHNLWPDADTSNVRGTIRSGLTAGMRQPLDWERGQPTPAAAPFTLADGHAVPDLIPPADRHGLAVALELATQRARREAKRLLDQEEAAASFRAPPSRVSLLDELNIPETPVAYAIADLLPAGGNALLTAQYKAGKTSTVNNLVRAYCDGEPFLGKYTVNPAPGRIAVFNYEVGDDLYRRWLRELDISNPDRATILNLRGFRLPITVPSVEDWVVNWLIERHVSFWVVDPFARAFTGCGDSENDNTAVGLFLDTLDVIKARAGVRDLVLPTHTGRMDAEQGQERSRGATRLEDWADVRWVLTQAEDEHGGPPHRFFRATGRDVEVAEAALIWNEADRSQTHTGGDRKWMERRRREQAVLDHVNAHDSCSFRDIKAAVGGKDDLIRNAIKSLETSGALTIEKVGSANIHHARRTDVTAPSMPADGFPGAAA